jgi:hypothetical protein
MSKASYGMIVAVLPRAEFPKAAFPVLRKNSAATRTSKQTFVGPPMNVCLGMAAA